MNINYEIKFYILKEKICAWSICDNVNKIYYNGAACPFKNTRSLDIIQNSDYYGLPYTKKQIKSFEYIGKYTEQFENIFTEAETLSPVEKYDNVIKNTFGPRSKVYQLYKEKAQPVKEIRQKPDLYIDFEAINMRVCGWYGELVYSDGKKEVFEGIARPFSDKHYVKRLWDNTYGNLLSYDFDDIAEANHIRSYLRYFSSMFSKARKIYTYGDTDALFIKSTFGVEMYNFFKVKNVDCSLRVGSRTVSLEKTCKLFNIDLEGVLHDPKYDVQCMQAYLQKSEEL